jgi:hypothetical protein
MTMTRFNHTAAVMAVVAAATLLTACEGPRRALGLEKTTPNEFAVVGRAPLSMPPDFKLRPPLPGADRPGEQAVVEQARQTVFGIEPAAGAGAEGFTGNLADLSKLPEQSVGEAVLLSRVGTEAAQPDIRAVVDRESAILATADETFLDRLLHWREPAAPGTVVNAEAEARRLRENQALGEPVTAGDTPVIERKSRGLLEGIF